MCFVGVVLYSFHNKKLSNFLGNDFLRGHRFTSKISVIKLLPATKNWAKIKMLVTLNIEYKNTV